MVEQSSYISVHDRELLENALGLLEVTKKELTSTRRNTKRATFAALDMQVSCAWCWEFTKKNPCEHCWAMMLADGQKAHSTPWVQINVSWNNEIQDYWSDFENNILWVHKFSEESQPIVMKIDPDKDIDRWNPMKIFLINGRTRYRLEFDLFPWWIQIFQLYSRSPWKRRFSQVSIPNALKTTYEVTVLQYLDYLAEKKSAA